MTAVDENRCGQQLVPHAAAGTTASEFLFHIREFSELTRISEGKRVPGKGRTRGQFRELWERKSGGSWSRKRQHQRLN